MFLSVRGENSKLWGLRHVAMSKFFRAKRFPNRVLMGAGAVLGSLSNSGSKNPALHDALALRRDQLAVGGDFWRAIETFDKARKADIAPDSKEALEKRDQ